MKNITVKKLEADRRLDIFLAKHFEQSRSQAQKIIKQGLVLVNEKAETAHYKVQAGDKIVIKKAQRKMDHSLRCASFRMKKQWIVAETNNYIIINKPAGVIMHGGDGIDEPTLADALEKKWPEIKKVGDNPLRPGIVHRLDKEASGLIVIAKNNKIFDHLKNQFQARAVKKEYTALVYGQLSEDEGEIDFPISRSSKGYKMAAHSHKQGGRGAITAFSVKQKFINYTLLNIRIKTGRTHQIRVHCSAYGHPIVGDNLYGTRKTREKNAKQNLARIFLHAHTLGFFNLKNEWQEFSTKLPAELKKVLKIIK